MRANLAFKLGKQQVIIPEDETTRAIDSHSSLQNEIAQLCNQLSNLYEELTEAHISLTEKALGLCNPGERTAILCQSMRSAFIGLIAAKDSAKSGLQNIESKCQARLGVLEEINEKFKAQELAAQRTRHYVLKVAQLQQKKRTQNASPSFLAKLTRNEAKLAAAHKEEASKKEYAKTAAAEVLSKKQPETLLVISSVLKQSEAVFNAANRVFSEELGRTLTQLDAHCHQTLSQPTISPYLPMGQTTSVGWVNNSEQTLWTSQPHQFAQTAPPLKPFPLEQGVTPKNEKKIIPPPFPLDDESPTRSERLDGPIDPRPIDPRPIEPQNKLFMTRPTFPGDDDPENVENEDGLFWTNIYPKFH